MAQLISVKLSRFDGSPWGFRLQGGKDFGAPLLIQKVNGGSLAEKAGLQAGDAVIKVNNAEVFDLRHKDAQDTIVRAGNSFELTVQRGGSTWKPSVTPVGPSPVINTSAPAANIAPVTKTSLAARPQTSAPIPSGHNVAAKPFGGIQVNGESTVKSIVNKQYNTPVGMYSEETIAETLSAQAEVLAGGVLGVNFKKNEKSYNAANSEVLKMVQEIDNEPREPEPDTTPGAATVTTPPVTGLRHVSAPETRSTPTTPHEDPFKILPPGQNICADCERLIVGVFVRIKDKNLHVECFKCATCGTSLKNVGYYNINNKLYCDIHAKMVARQHPPAPNLEPITIPPGSKAPAGAISAALAGAPGLRQVPSGISAPRPVPIQVPSPAPPTPSSPQTMGPVPFHTPTGIAPPKPFGAPSASTTSPARPAPVSNKFVWPPKREEETMSLAPTATPLYIAPVPSQHPKEISIPSAPFVPEHSTAAHILPERYPAQEFGETSHPSYPSHPVPVQMTKEVIHPFPLPYSDFISSQKEYQMKIVSPSPAPFTKQIENQIFKYLENSVCPTNLPSREQDYNTNIQFQMEQKTEEAKVHKKASVCSQEVSLITATKSTAIEKISESFDSKVVVTSSIQAQERPPSPVPTKQTEEEQYMGAEATSIPNINNPVENVVKEVSSTQAASQEKRQEICLEIKILSNPHEQSKSELPTVNHNNNPKSNPNSVTNPISNPNSDTKSASNPNPSPASNPNTNPASNPNTNPASNPNTNPASNPNTNPASNSNTNPASNPNTNLASNPNTNPASNPNTNPGSNPNTNLASNPNPDTNPASNPNPDTKPASNPNPDTNPASNPNPDTKPASNPNPDTKPASNPNPDTNPASNPNPDDNPVSNPNPDTDSMSNTNHNTKLVSNPNPNTNLPSNPNPLPNSNNNPNPLTNPNNNPNPLPNPNNNPNPLPTPNNNPNPLPNHNNNPNPLPNHNNSNPLTNPNILPNPNTNIISSTNVVTHPNTNINPRTNPNSDTNINVKSDIVGNREEKWQQGAVVNKSQAVYQTEKVYESSLVETSQSTSMVTQIQHTSLPATDLSAPKGWQSPFVAALTTAPERPYSPFPTSTVSQDLTVSKQSDQQSFESRSPGLSYRQLPMQSNGSFRPISTEYQSTSYQEMSNISTEHSSSIAAPVPFPVQTAPYRPKVEIASSNPMTRSDECPSPMLRALTIAPERPYSPLPGATKAQITTAYQPQAVITQAPSCNQPAVPQQNRPPSKPSMSDETLLPLLPVPSKHMSMLEALTVAPDRPYSPFKPNAIPNTVVQSEASAFTAVSPQAVTTGPRFSSPKATTATPNIFKPLPKSSTLPRAQVSTPVNSSSPRPSSRTSLPVMGGFRPTVPADLSSAGTSQNYLESQAAFSESLSDFQMSQPVEAEVSIVDSSGTIVKRTRRVEESFSHSHKEMQKVIQRSVGQAPIVSSSEFQQHYEQSGQLHQTTVHKQDMKHIQQHQAVKQEHRHTSSFGTELPPAIPFYQKDIERYQVQRALSPAPHSPQVRALSPVPQGQRPATPKQHINKPVTPTFQTKPPKTVSYSPHVEKKPCVSFQSPIPSPAKFYEQQQEQQQQKIYSLSSVQKPSVVPYYQKDIERYQIQRALSPAPHSQHVRALSPVPQQQRECSPSPQLVSQAQPSHSILKPSSTPQVRQDTNIGQSVQTMQRMQVQSQRRQQASPTGLHTPSSIPFYQQDIERYQMQRAISPAPHSPSVRALSPTPQSVPYQQSGANRGMLPQESQSFPCSFPEDNRTYAAVQNKPQGPNYMLPSKSTQSTSAFKSLPIGPQSPSPFTSQSQFPSNVASQLGAVTKTPVPPTSSSIPNAGVGGVGGIGGGVGGGPSQKGTASIAGSSAPRRGRGILNQQTPGTRIPLCGYCNGQIRGPFITALGKIWCPDHFVCVNGQCRRPLQDIGFVEEKGDLYCEYCFEQFIAPNCDKCSKKVKGDCLNAIGKHFHPECFLCAYCGKMFGNNPFYLEDGLPYCEADWNELFTTKCFACGFPIEAGDRWVEALNNNYHSQCFNCTNCKKNLEGQSFYAKGGRPFCKAHAR